MLEIRLTPKLHNAVHLLKSIELNQASNSFLPATALSREETSAILNTFTTKQKKEKDPVCNWI
ncbi:hypothetical protein [Paenibacillus alba]|uniref:Uncharacterized protein n=1 Tax=Paenibacillus alba TaxID=1197127 RepID=A0ABU6FZH5_9BACL|nr:hypothetical protein [Paenibacillus alba]MEC0227306.1 hypothetical protein [Paenibacillus alba]